MRHWNRREVLKSGMAAVAGLSPGAVAVPASQARADAPAPEAAPAAGPGRERLLLDFGWRFHLGHVFDPALDFGFASATAPTKSGGLSPSELKFDDTAWQPIDLPHDWAVELGFENDHDLLNNGFKPLGRSYPTASIGWYRRVFEIPAADLGRRITIEFDGVFRDCEAAINGYTLERNKSGYAPFRYDITDFPRLRSQERTRGPRRCDPARGMVVRGRGDLSTRLAREDASGARRALGNVRDFRNQAGGGGSLRFHRDRKLERFRAILPRRLGDPGSRRQ